MTTTGHDLEAEIATVMECPPALLPLLPELLRDLPDLSGATADVLDLLADAGLAPGSRVLDVGCGRGDVALAVVRRFDVAVDGVDAFAPFVASALARAAAAGLAQRCRFRQADLRTALAGGADYDAVLYVALGPLLGDPAATVAALRRRVRPGGAIVIDDAFLAPGHAPPAAWPAYRDRATTEAGLTAWGDRIEGVRLAGPASEAFAAATLAAIRRRVAELHRRHPDRAADLDAYLARQIEEFALLAPGGGLVAAIWRLCRSPSFKPGSMAGADKLPVPSSER